MSRQVAILVEGQTEEAFVKRVLQPLVGCSNADLTPIVVHTSRAASGAARRGGGQWRHYRSHLQKLLAQPHWAMVTTLVDFYGYPDDAPSCSCTGVHLPSQCADSRQAAMREALGSDRRFAPFVVVHEFEALVIAAGSLSASFLGSEKSARTLRELVEGHDGDAEQINDSPETAPSKRLKTLHPKYNKVRDGIDILDGRLLDAMELTPRFAKWVESLTSENRAQ